MTKGGFDWAGLEQAAIDQVLTAVRLVRRTHPEEQIYGAIFHEFYGDGESLYWPCLTVGTEESLAKTSGGDSDEGLRWSGPDLVYTEEPGEVEEAWAQRCAELAAAAGRFADWQKVYRRFERCFPKAAKRARAQLVAEGAVGRDFIAVAMDEAGELVPPSLTKAQLRTHFPEYDAADAERRRLAALSVADQVAEVVPHGVRARRDGLLVGEYDDLVIALGEAAVPALLDVVAKRQPGEPVAAFMLLAAINHDSPEVLAVCRQAVVDESVDLNTRAWAASATAHLGRSDLIGDLASVLPAAVIGRGLAHPYRSFRDMGNHRPLDYRSLEAVLAAHPELEPVVATELQPGRGFCRIDNSELEAAQAGLDSPCLLYTSPSPRD